MFYGKKKQLLQVNLGRLTSSKDRRFFVTLVMPYLPILIRDAPSYFPDSGWKMLGMPINLVYAVLSPRTRTSGHQRQSARICCANSMEHPCKKTSRERVARGTVVSLS